MFSDNPESAERGYRYRKQGQRFYPMLELGVKEDRVEPVLGVVAGQKIKLFFNSLIDDDQGQRQIEDLPLPLSIMADIGTGERVVLDGYPIELLDMPGLRAGADAVEAREAEETEAAVATEDPAEEGAAEEAAQAPAEQAPVEETPVEEVSTEVPSEESAADETAPEEPPADPADAPDEPEASGEGEVNS